MLLLSVKHCYFQNSSTLNLSSSRVYHSLSGRENSCKGKRKITHNVTKEDSLCLIPWLSSPIQNALVHAVYSLKTPAYLQLYNFLPNLTQELPPPRKFASFYQLCSSQSNILNTSLLVSISDYIITHSSSFSCHISGTVCFHSITTKHLESRWWAKKTGPCYHRCFTWFATFK